MSRMQDYSSAHTVFYTCDCHRKNNGNTLKSWYWFCIISTLCLVPRQSLLMTFLHKVTFRQSLFFRFRPEKNFLYIAFISRFTLNNNSEQALKASEAIKWYFRQSLSYSSSFPYFFWLIFHSGKQSRPGILPSLYSACFFIHGEKVSMLSFLSFSVFLHFSPVLYFSGVWNRERKSIFSCLSDFHF